MSNARSRSEGGSRNYSDSNDNDSIRTKHDYPPNSRLFIVCGKNVSEEQFQKCFEPFGNIEEVWMVKDRVTQELKGVAYIKFSKTSEAALAMEEMNGRCIEGSPRPLKVLIAHSRHQGSRRDANEEERLVRLFVVVPRSLTEADLRQHFSTFGDIDYVSIVKDRMTKESKGYGYVKYHKMSHAAIAFEECDRNYKPVFAEPKPQKPAYDISSPSDNRFMAPCNSSDLHMSTTSAYDMLSFMDSSVSNPDNVCQLHVVVNAELNQDQLWRLFDLVPGLDFCDIKGSEYCGGNRRHTAIVVYNNPQSAAYAKQKLHGFEYPPGCRLYVALDMDVRRGCSSYGRSQIVMPNDVAQLRETIATATALLQTAGYSQNGMRESLPLNTDDRDHLKFNPDLCSVVLPPPQPLANISDPMVQRLFIVCIPSPPPLHILREVFSRFGSFIELYLLNGKGCGYVKYASKESAERAMSTLHGQEICSCRLKVMLAEPQVPGRDTNRKRQRISE